MRRDGVPVTPRLEVRCHCEGLDSGGMDSAQVHVSRIAVPSRVCGFVSAGSYVVLRPTGRAFGCPSLRQ